MNYWCGGFALGICCWNGTTRQALAALDSYLVAGCWQYELFSGLSAKPRLTKLHLRFTAAVQPSAA